MSEDRCRGVGENGKISSVLSADSMVKHHAKNYESITVVPT